MLHNLSVQLRTHRADLLIALVGFVAAVVVVWLASGAVDQRLLDRSTMDLWFEADAPRVFENVVDRWSNHYRAAVHPIYSLLMYPVVWVLTHGFQMEPWAAVRVVLAVIAGAWVVTMYLVLRLVCGRSLDAGVFTLLGATSAGMMFWVVIPETHPLGSLTVGLALLLVAVSQHRSVPEPLDVVASAATLGITVTNWMVGLASVVVRRPWRRSMQISANALVLVLVLWTVRKELMPSTRFFIGHQAEAGQVFAPESRGPLGVTTSFLAHSMIMPAITVVDRPSTGTWPIMVTQPSAPGSAGPWGAAGLVFWIILLGLGVMALLTVPRLGPMRAMLAMALAGQLVLYIAFGTETFLYAPVVVPLLVTMVAIASLTRWRPLALAVAAGVIVAGGANNGLQWRRAVEFLDEFAPLEHNPARARLSRADDPWPSKLDADTEVIGLTGTSEFSTAHSNLAGSFSPATGTFVVGFWVLGPSGAPLRSSSTAPFLNGIAHPRRIADSTIVGVKATTDSYRAVWEEAGPGRWRLELDVESRDPLALVVRSVGMNAGPIRLLEWDGRRLVINARWEVRVEAGAVQGFLVDENAPGWISARPATRRLVVPDGWGAARLVFQGAGSYRILIADLEPGAPVDHVLTTLPSSKGRMGLLLDPA